MESDEPIDELSGVGVHDVSTAPAGLRISKWAGAGPRLDNAVVLPALGHLAEASWLSIARSPDGYCLSFAEDATFWVAVSGRVIDWFEGPSPRETQVHLLLDHVVPRALSLLGANPLHATAVAMSGKAIAFLANTGAGKSTLAAKLVSEGCELVTDDCLVLSYSDAEPLVLAAPGYVGPRLYDDARTAGVLRGSGGAHGALYGQEVRVWVLCFSDGERSAVCHLLAREIRGRQRGRASGVRAMTRADAVTALTSQSFRMDASLRDLLTGQLRFCSQVAGRVPVKRCKVRRIWHVRGVVGWGCSRDRWRQTMSRQSQISATISEATKERLDRFTENHRLKKNFVVEYALLYFMEARRELPASSSKSTAQFTLR